MARPTATLFLLFACASSAIADEVMLRNGHKLVGIQREEKDRIIVETGYGTVSLPREEVVSVTKGDTALHAYPVRYAEVEKSRNAADFTKLAAWARENAMPRYVPELMRRAVELDPDNAEARASLGFVRHQGRWVTHAELKKEQGLVQDGGRWVLPLEKALAERRRLEAESRKLERESEQREREERRRRARQEAQLQARLQAATRTPILADSPRAVWRPMGVWYGESKLDYTDLLLFDFVMGFRNAYSSFYYNQFAQPIPSSQPGSAPRSGGGRLTDVKPGQSFPLP